MNVGDWCISMNVGDWCICMNVGDWCICMNVGDWCICMNVGDWCISMNVGDWCISMNLNEYHGGHGCQGISRQRVEGVARNRHGDRLIDGSDVVNFVFRPACFPFPATHCKSRTECGITCVVEHASTCSGTRFTHPKNTHANQSRLHTKHNTPCVQKNTLRTSNR